MTLELENFEIEAEEHEEGEEEEEEEVGSGASADDNLGHVHIYFDSFDTNPIIQLEDGSPEGDGEIPADAAVGPHVLIARLHGTDHLIIEPEVTAEADFEVTE